MSDPNTAMLLMGIGRAGAQAAAGQAAQRGSEEMATQTLEFSEEEAVLLEKYGGKQGDYLKEQAQLRHDYAIKGADLAGKQVSLFEAGTKRDIRDERKAAGDRERSRQRRILDALGSQAATRASQGIAAYEGSPLNMQRTDYLQFQREQAIDRGDTADRIVDLKFFGGERAKLMRERNDMMRSIAGTELASAVSSADLRLEGIAMQAGSIRRASQLEAQGLRIQGRYAKRQGNMAAIGSLLDVGYTAQQTGMFRF